MSDGRSRRSKFTPEIRGGLVERIAAGVSLRDACRAVEVSEPTVKTWLTKGRKGEPGYDDFATSLDEARETAKKRRPPMDADELARVVSQAARLGSVAAMKLRWEMLNLDRNGDEDEDEDEPQKPLAAVDELAAKRAGAG